MKRLSNLALNPAKFTTERLRNPLRLLLSPRHSADRLPADADLPSDPRVDPAIKVGPASVRVMFGVDGDNLHKHAIKRPLLTEVKGKVHAGAKLSKPEWAQRLADLRKRLGQTQAEFAKTLGVSQVAVSRWEAGLDRPTAEKFILIGQCAPAEERMYWLEQGGVTRERISYTFADIESRLYRPTHLTLELIPAMGSVRPDAAGGVRLKKKPDAVAVPLLKDAAAAGSPRLVMDADVEETLVIPRKMCPHPDRTTCVRVKGDSMSPILDDGDIVAIDATVQERPKLYSKMVAARDPEGGVTIKWLRKSGKDELLVPQHTSLRHQPIVITGEPEWKIIGRVIWRLGLMP